jgi:cell division initiation protein
MAITPIDIQQHRFKSRPFGYDKAAVDRFLELVAEEMERLSRQAQELREELSRTRSGLDEMQSRETMLKETLLTAQRITDELKANARKEAEIIIAEAELRAERVVRDAEDRRLHLIGEIQEIKRRKVSFETSLRALLESHSRMLALDLVPVESEEDRLLEEVLPFGKRGEPEDDWK